MRQSTAVRESFLLVLTAEFNLFSVLQRLVPFIQASVGGNHEGRAPGRAIRGAVYPLVLFRI